MEDKVFTFELTESEANLVLAGLGKLPAEAVLGLILKLQKSAQEQNSAASTEV